MIFVTSKYAQNLCKHRHRCGTLNDAKLESTSQKRVFSSSKEHLARLSDEWRATDRQSSFTYPGDLSTWMEVRKHPDANCQMNHRDTRFHSRLATIDPFTIRPGYLLLSSPLTLIISIHSLRGKSKHNPSLKRLFRVNLLRNGKVEPGLISCDTYTNQVMITGTNGTIRYEAGYSGPDLFAFFYDHDW